MWKPITVDLDLTEAKTYRHVRDTTAGRWYLLPGGQVVHETVDGNRQVSLHSAEALADRGRFIPA